MSSESTALFSTIGPLPVRGRSWPKAIAILAWLLIAIIGVRLVYIATTYGQQVDTPIIAGVILAYSGMIVVAFYMLTGQTTISEHGIQQDWILKRELAWEDLKFAKFVPLFFSKRLICFTKRGRPVVFQGASPELQIAFAHISLIYKRTV
ncbi:hypothetical protein [Paenalcaligenes sp.]|uniref:hypothetical protein n=1 Tax=Paenalcaligenes sp. TaxID=1966342 RepID=UPI002601B092|nr:hypothetical protein [Paenalcaligenes sp.]